MQDIEITELEAIDKEDNIKNPFLLIEEGRLSIKTKESTLIKLVLNKAQRIILETIKKLRAAGKPVRLWVLKARQEGVSTLSEGITYSLCSQRENINALIMADEKEHANNLFEMSKLYQEQLEKTNPHLAPKLKKSNEKKLEFENTHSQIIIATAENKEAAISHTFQIVHLSELAYFSDMKTVMSNLNQSVPDALNTIVIGESTANGLNEYYKQYKRAVHGKTDWTPIFIPWHWMDEYSMPLSGGMYPLEGIIFNENFTKEQFVLEEDEGRKKYRWTDEQINWRRHKIVNSLDGDIDLFRQFYPSHWEEAFRMSGANFFSREGLKQQKLKVRKPLAIGDIFFQDGKYTFRELPTGKIKIYEYPDVHEEYIITADASEALGQDESSIYVGNKRLNQDAAVVNGQYPPEELAHVCIMLGNYYNNAVIAPENKGYGYMVCQLVFKSYGNIYWRTKTKGGSAEEMNEIGFNTNLITRPDMLARFAEEIRINNTAILDTDLYDQCTTFIINPKNKKPEAASGAQDGLVICRSIFSMIRAERPYMLPSNADTESEALYYNLLERRKNGGIRYRK